MAPLHFPKIALPSSISGTNMKNVNLNNDPLDLTNTSFLFLKINPIHGGGGGGAQRERAINRIRSRCN